MTEPIIKIEDLYKYFGNVQALRGVSLDVFPGEVVIVIGPSGSGKSTLLRCINHLEKPTNGHVYIEGVDLESKKTNINKMRTEIGMVFQQFNLFPHLSVLENITLAQRIVRKRPKIEREKVALDLLERVGIPEKSGSYPGQLSGGQQQRVAIARALAMEPEVMLFDEPTTGLDPVNARRIDRLIRELSRTLGVTAVVVSHDLPSIMSVADRVAFLYQGRVHALGTPADLAASSDPIVQQFIAGSATGPMETPGF